MRPSKDDNDDDKRPPDESATSRPAVERTHGDEKLQLLAEELSVAKEKMETGRVRVSTRTGQREVLVDEDLTSERVEIETVPLGSVVDTSMLQDTAQGRPPCR